MRFFFLQKQSKHKEIDGFGLFMTVVYLKKTCKKNQEENIKNVMIVMMIDEHAHNLHVVHLLLNNVKCSKTMEKKQHEMVSHLLLK